MRTDQLHRASTAGLLILSLGAFFLVAGAALRIVLSGELPPRETDEGAAARIFQLLIVALLPVGLLFLGTADWTRPAGVIRRLALPATAVIAAFVTLYIFEHYLQR